MIASINPATGEVLREFEAHGDAEIEAKLTLAAEVFRGWRTTAVEDRMESLRRVADLLDLEKRRFAELMTREMGKPIGAAVSEVEKCAWVCRYYAEHAAAQLADQEIETDAARAFVRFQPLGPVLAIMPWNFPFWQVFRFAAPALTAGNVGLLKHASNVPQCALALEEIFLRAGYPEGVFQALLIEPERVGALLDDPRIRAATLTGSVRAGRAVGSGAGQRIKKTVLELGGSDPFIVMPSADLDAAIETAVKARTINNGQSCIAAKRIIVHDAVADAFQERFVAAMDALVVGDPLKLTTDLGPMAMERLRDDLHAQVRQTIDAGATLLTGGVLPEERGWFYPPTVLSEVPEDSPAYRDELFGPVAALFRARDVDDAIRIANDTRFGLGSAAWTTQPEERERFIDELEAGLVFINGMVASDPRLPFGGIKESGYGRELAEFGIREFVNIKTVSIAAAGSETE